MKTLRLAPLLLVLLGGCITVNDHDDHDSDRDGDYSQAQERAEKYCVQEAKSRGLRIEDVGRIDKVGKKEYTVKLRVDDKYKDKKDKDDDYVLYCRYDDKDRDARLD